MTTPASGGLIDRDQLAISCKEPEGRRRDEEYNRDGDNKSLPEQAIEGLPETTAYL